VKTQRKLRQGLVAINTAANTLTELINTLLDISRIEMGNTEVTKEDINLRDMIETEITGKKLSLNKKIKRLRSKLNDTLPEYIQCNRRLLQIILQNLISNAVKYNKIGGRSDRRGKESEGRHAHQYRRSRDRYPPWRAA